jgi:hypothetical protein
VLDIAPMVKAVGVLFAGGAKMEITLYAVFFVIVLYLFLREQ